MARKSTERGTGFRNAFAMVATLLAAVLFGTSTPAAAPVLLPLAYVLCIGFGLRWIVDVNRKVAGRSDAPRSAGRVHVGTRAGSLPAQEILGWEFEYARRTASEATNDRQALVNYYLAFAGALPTAVVLLIIEGPDLERLPGYNVLGVWALWALVLVGWIFFLKIVRLRQAWYNSVEAMNAIKSFYLDHVAGLSREEMAPAFLWKPQTLPKPEKTWTVFFLSATLIAFLNSLSFVMGAALLSDHPEVAFRDASAMPASWLVLPLFGLGMFALHMVAYTALLRDPKGGSSPMSVPDAEPDRPSRRVEVMEQTRECDSFLKVDRVKLRFEQFDGDMSEPIVRYVVERGDAVAVLPYDPERNAVLLVQQFRYPAYVRDGPGWLWEIVAGMQDKGRDRVSVAHAEMMEEAGYELQGLSHIASFYPSPGSLTERVFLYLGYIRSAERTGAGGGLAGESEDIALKLFPLRDALKMVETGEICDAKTIVGLQWIALHKDNLSRPVKS